MSQPSHVPTHKLSQGSQKSEWVKFIAGFGFAFHGLAYAVRTQRNVRVHIAAAALAILMGTILHITALEFALIFIAITGVFISEMFNTVMEICIDLVTPEYHPLAKIAKDVAAGAVLMNAILAVIIALCIFGPHLLLFLHR